MIFDFIDQNLANKLKYRVESSYITQSFYSGECLPLGEVQIVVNFKVKTYEFVICWKEVLLARSNVAKSVKKKVSHLSVLEKLNIANLVLQLTSLYIDWNPRWLLCIEEILNKHRFFPYDLIFVICLIHCFLVCDDVKIRFFKVVFHFR